VSDWWKDLCGVRDGVGVQENDCLEVGMRCHLSNGEQSFFKNDHWLE